MGHALRRRPSMWWTTSRAGDVRGGLRSGARQRAPAVRSQSGQLHPRGRRRRGLPATTKFAGVFHHVSRHLSDRPKTLRRCLQRARGRGICASSARRRTSVDVSRERRPSSRSVRTWTTRGRATGTSWRRRRMNPPRRVVSDARTGELYGTDAIVRRDRGVQHTGASKSASRLIGTRRPTRAVRRRRTSARRDR